jgi:hypothetical protein
VTPLGEPIELDSSGLVHQSPNGEGRRSFLEKKMPWFNRNCYRVGQDLVCMLSENFPEKADSQPKEQSLLEESFLREMGGHILFKTQIGILGGA